MWVLVRVLQRNRINRRYEREYIYIFSRFSHVWLCNSMDYGRPGSSVHGNSLGKNIGVGFIYICFSLLSIILFTKKMIRTWSKRGPLQFSFFIELLLLCWFLLLTLSPMLKSVTCEKLELSSLVSEWPPDTLLFYQNRVFKFLLSPFVLEPLSFSQIPESGDLCPCSWTPRPPIPTHLPDTLSNLDRGWQANDWRVETFCWHIYPLQCPGARTFDFRGI